MAKVYVRWEEKLRIIQEALAFQGIMPVEGNEADYQSHYETMLNEINSQDGQAIPDNQVPNLVMVSLQCGLSFPVPPWGTVIDRRTKGIIR